MKQIKLSDTHYIVVDETQEIKEGDWCIMLDSFGNLFSGCQQYLGESAGHYLNKGHIKITHSTQPIVNNYIGNTTTQVVRDAMKAVSENVRKPKVVRDGIVNPIIKEYPLSLAKKIAGEVDVKKKADFDSKNHYLDQSDYWAVGVDSYKRGYKESLEDNKDKKYTEEDIANAITFGWDLSHYHRLNTEEKLLKMQKDYIQSLQPPTEWEVEIIEGKLKRKDP